MKFWKEWREEAEAYRKLEELHKNEYELDHSSAGGETTCTLYRPLGDGDLDFPAVSMDVMRELLAAFQVVTHVWTWDFGYRKNRENSDPQNYFPYQYYQKLMLEGKAQDVYYDQGTELLTLTTGIDTQLMEALLDRGRREIWSNSVCMYGYRSYPFDHREFDKIKAAVGQDSCDIFITYEEQHDQLKIQVNRELLEIEYVIEVVRRACSKYGKRLEVISE